MQQKLEESALRQLRLHGFAFIGLAFFDEA